MLVSLALRGGFAGFDRPLGAVDLDLLPAPRAKQAREQLGTLRKLARTEREPDGADALRYEVTVRDGAVPAPPITIFDEGDWERPIQLSLARLAETLGVPLT